MKRVESKSAVLEGVQDQHDWGWLDRELSDLYCDCSMSCREAWSGRNLVSGAEHIETNGRRAVRVHLRVLEAA